MAQVLDDPGSLRLADSRLIIAREPMHTHQILAIAIATALNGLDGFDVLSISFASPGIAQQWGVDRAALGMVLSMELIGMAIGAFASGGRARRRNRTPSDDSDMPRNHGKRYGLGLPRGRGGHAVRGEIVHRGGNRRHAGHDERNRGRTLEHVPAQSGGRDHGGWISDGRDHRRRDRFGLACGDREMAIDLRTGRFGLGGLRPAGAVAGSAGGAALGPVVAGFLFSAGWSLSLVAPMGCGSLVGAIALARVRLASRQE